MNIDNLEKDLQQYYKDSSSNVDTDLLWDRVQPHIPQPKKRRRITPFIFFISMTIATLSVLLVYNHKKAALEFDSRISENKISDEVLKNNQSTSATFDQETTNPSTISQVFANQNEYPQKEKNNKNQEIIKNEPSSIDGRKVKNNTAISLSETSTSNYKRKISLPIVKPEESYPISKHNTAQNLKERNKITLSNNSNNAGSKNYISNNVNVIDQLNQSIIPSVSNSKLKGIHNSNSQSSYSLLPLIGIHSLDIRDQSKINTAPRKWSPRIYHRDRNKFSIEIGAGYYVPIRKFELANSEFENSFSNRSDAESILEGWNTRVNFGYEIIPNLKVTLGLNYLNINERSKATITNVQTYIAQDTVIGSFVRLDGSVEDILGDAEINKTIIKNVNRINSYKYLNIPVEVVYSIPIQRMTFDIGTGFSKNISLTASGYWHPDENTEYDISTDDNNYLKEHSGISLIGHLGISFRVSPSFGLYARSRFIHQLNPINQNDYGIEQQYQLIGGEIGLRTSF